MKVDRKVTTLAASIVGMTTLCLAGCGTVGPPKANVSGSVTYKGNPVTGGNLKLHFPDDPAAAAYAIPLRRDGTFNITDVPPGNTKVTIETETVKLLSQGPNMAKMPKPPKDTKDANQAPPAASGDGPVYMKIPAKYADVKTTPFTWELKLGNNTKTFELTD